MRDSTQTRCRTSYGTMLAINTSLYAHLLPSHALRNPWRDDRTSLLLLCVGVYSKFFCLQLSNLYTDNSAKAKLNSPQKSSPGLYIAIHDPALTFQQALAQNFTRMTLINANAQTAINLGLHYRQANDYSEAYDYNMMISSVPAQSVACEWDGGKVFPTTACFASLHIQYPTFHQTIIKRPHSMQWSVSAWGQCHPFKEELS